MDIEVLNNIKSNIEELNIAENESSLIEIELYQRTAKDLLKQKTAEMQKFLKEEAIYYKQDPNQYVNKINGIVKTYSEYIEKVIKAYERIYADCFSIRQNARDNQKTCVTNICLIEKKKQDAKNTQKDQYSDMQLYYAQKKVNYTVLINECTARILWGITHMEEDVLSIYNGSTMALSVTNDNKGLFYKIKLYLYGKKYYKEFLDKISKETLNKILSEVENKVNVIASIEKGFLKQVKMMNKGIQKKSSEQAA